MRQDTHRRRGSDRPGRAHTALWGGVGGGLARRFAEICETTRCSRRATVSDQKMNPHSTIHQFLYRYSAQCKEKSSPVHTHSHTHTAHLDCQTHAQLSGPCTSMLRLAAARLALGCALYPPHLHCGVDV